MNRRGTALFIVVLLLLLLAALSALALSAARIRLTGGRNELARSEVLLLAEGRVLWQAGQWDPLLAETLTIGSHAVLPSGVSAPGVTGTDSIERLGPGLYLIGTTAERRSTAGILQARERTGQLVARTAPSLRGDAAVVVAGSITVVPGATVDGSDSTLSSWGALCPPPAPPGAGIILGPAGRLDPAGCVGAPCLSGAPPLGMDSTVSAGWLQQLGLVPIDSLIAHADQRLGGLTVGVAPALTPGGACDRAVVGNLGDPSSAVSPCANFLPITVASPGTELRDGSGQGLLIGLGAVTLSGAFQFDGVVLALGPVTLRDQAQVIGAVAAQDSVLVRGVSRIRRSTCTVRRTATGSARPFFPVPRRWFRAP